MSWICIRKKVLYASQLFAEIKSLSHKWHSKSFCCGQGYSEQPINIYVYRLYLASILTIVKIINLIKWCLLVRFHSENINQYFVMFFLIILISVLIINMIKNKTSWWPLKCFTHALLPREKNMCVYRNILGKKWVGIWGLFIYYAI